MPKGLIGCEISVVGAQGDEIREGKLFERARFLVNPINEKAQRFIDELIDRGVLTYS